MAQANKLRGKLREIEEMEAEPRDPATHGLVLDRSLQDNLASEERMRLPVDKVSTEGESVGDLASDGESAKDIASEDEDSSLMEDDADNHPSKKQKALDNLYCVQWVNIVDKNPVPVHIYKIGRGQEGREQRVHGTNPVRFPVIRIWGGAGHLETKVHDLLHAYHYYQDAGQEWFDLEHAKDNVGMFLDACILKALRGDAKGNGDLLLDDCILNALKGDL